MVKKISKNLVNFKNLYNLHLRRTLKNINKKSKFSIFLRKLTITDYFSFIHIRNFYKIYLRDKIII